MKCAKGKVKINKKSKKRKKTIENDNPFNDISFWFTIATTDFSFGLFENDKKITSKSDEHTAEENKTKI